MSNAPERLLDHDYDGIQEYDNPMPGWWSGIFVGSMIFAVAYGLYFDVLHVGPSRLDEYSDEVAIQAKIDAAVEATFAISPEDLDAYTKDPAHIAAGAVKFKETCVACHGDKAEGKIGPNLTDKFWIHGGKTTEIYMTVRKGVADKGMPVWGRTMKPEEIRNLVAYVTSIRDTNVAGKDPQGQAADGSAAPTPAGAAQP